MYELFYKYLILNKKAGIPGIGNFEVQSVPAHLDFVTKTISAPAQSIRFDTEKVSLDRSFYNYLSRELNVNEIEAINQFNEFSHKLKDIAVKGGVQLPGIGILHRSLDGEVSFREEKHDPVFTTIHLNASPAADANLVDLYGSGETRIITQDVPHEEEEKIVMKDKEDYWWVYAIVLALLGVGALLYYYI
ncbi:MAG: hypothetical protein KGO81_05745 [Bacteroidota bacterium]|nr:hypothetical protein [Bacteroidota bacterium]